ncbi:MAG TPA: hypothetical protein IAD50_05335, partial [Candidatus Egerieisoma faecipullorum]|nr:hypothetical protein [Candidatus Egerieisoma faecipullorum]
RKAAGGVSLPARSDRSRPEHFFALGAWQKPGEPAAFYQGIHELPEGRRCWRSGFVQFGVPFMRNGREAPPRQPGPA